MTDLAALFNRESINSDLFQKYQSLVEAEPKLRRRDIADRLDVPEASLIDQQCGLSSVRLQSKFSDIIYALPELGYIMTLTRNDVAVHERKGIYDNIRITGPMGLVISPDRKIDLRIILSRWASGFAVQEQVGEGFRYSLQFFDKAGQAIQKIFLQPDSNETAYSDLVTNFSEKSPEALTYDSTLETPEYVSDEEVDRSALKKEWETMTDVHQFFGILRKHKISREQAFRLVGAPYAEPVSPSILESMLTQASGTELPIMCFVGNQGNIQIHSGPVNNIKKMGPWLNVLDPEFNLHLLEDGVSSGWLIRKPTVDGMVTSLEFYDANGDTIAQFFGVREEGNPENAVWRSLAESFLPEGEAA